jgi:hypothetical protein
MMKNEAKFEDLIGKTLKSIGVPEDRESMTFASVDGELWAMSHDQDCQEYVRIEDIVGNLDDLIGSPILQAEEVIEDGEARKESNGDDCFSTWTFYKLATAKGYVTIRWLGESNGYYSERVDFHKLGD